MRRLILTAMIAGLLAPAGLHAQKAYRDENNRVILDLTVDAGMPAGAITDVSKTSKYAPHGSSAAIPDNTQVGALNAKVYHKLEIAPYDTNVSGGQVISGTVLMTWAQAYTACKGIFNYDGRIQWRLPTQRELQLMYIFKTALNTLIGASGTAFSESGYWSATQYHSVNPYSWFVRFNDGGTVYASSSSTSYVYSARCVREVTD